MEKQTQRISCSDISQNLYDYLTGRTSTNLRPVIAEHLVSCGTCRSELDELKTTLDLLDQAKPPKVSDDFTERVLESLEPKVIPFTRQPVYRFFLQCVAAAILVLAVFLIIKLLS